MNDILNIIHADLNRSQREYEATKIRHQNYLDQCSDNGIKFKVSSGVTSELQTFHNINLAHKKVIAQAKADGLESCLIAESDFVMSSPGAWKYFLSQLPESYDLFCGLIYHGTVQDGRILSAFSGGLTMYSIHSRFYDDVLGITVDEHIDREIGKRFSQTKELLCCVPMVCTQLGGYSYNLVRSLTYTEIENRLVEEGKEFYKG